MSSHACREKPSPFKRRSDHCARRARRWSGRVTDLTTLSFGIRSSRRRTKSESTMPGLSRHQVKFETALIARGQQGLQNRAFIEVQPSGVAELDAVLGGGFPRGSLVELCGPASSGRTSLAFSLLAQATGRQEACA